MLMVNFTLLLVYYQPNNHHINMRNIKFTCETLNRNMDGKGQHFFFFVYVYSSCNYRIPPRINLLQS